MTTLTLYALQDHEGNYYRSTYWRPWVADLGQAKLYKKIGPARARATYFANHSKDHRVPFLVEIEGRVVGVVDETDRVSESQRKKEAAREERRKAIAKQELEQAKQAMAEAKKKIAELTGR